MSTIEENNQSTLRTNLLALGIERHSRQPVHVALALSLKSRILAGQLPAGTRLPSSRSLAEDLSVSRATVVAAVDQLVAEGYVEGRRGSGVYVSTDLPDAVLQSRPCTRPAAMARRR